MLTYRDQSSHSIQIFSSSFRHHQQNTRYRGTWRGSSHRACYKTPSIKHNSLLIKSWTADKFLGLWESEIHKQWCADVLILPNQSSPNEPHPMCASVIGKTLSQLHWLSFTSPFEPWWFKAKVLPERERNSLKMFYRSIDIAFLKSPISLVNNALGQNTGQTNQ